MQGSLEKNIEKINIYLYCLVVSFVFLLICSKSSFLYPLNDWVDSNCFFTVGKGMMNGKVIYRDLIEQKGPLLYFIHGIAYLISNKTFIGVFIFEVISFSGFLYWGYKINVLFIKSKYIKILITLIAMMILTCFSFCKGDSAEEFIVPLLTVSLYYFLYYFKNENYKRMDYKILFTNGIIAGCVLWIKYTMLGFWFGWMMFIFINMVINKDFYRGIKSCIVFLMGILVATLPWIIYFASNNGLNEWINTYFIMNMTSYGEKMNVFSRIKTCIELFVLSIKTNRWVAFLSLIGGAPLILSNKYIRSNIGKTALISMGILLIIGVYFGGVYYQYYFFIFTAFSILAPMTIINIFKFIIGKKIYFMSRSKIYLMEFISIMICIILCFKFGNYTQDIGEKREKLVQYKFAKIINETDGATLLNYGFLDGGFYTTTGIIPNTKYFCKLNINEARLPEMMEEQNKVIEKKKVDYIVLKFSIDNKNFNTIDVPYLEENYELCSKFFDENIVYSLYKVK